MTCEEKPRTVYWLGDKLYLNITNKCSNNCIFCLKKFKRGLNTFTLKLEEEPSVEQIITDLEEALQKRVWKEVVFCGFGEPTERLDVLLEVSKWIKQRAGKSTQIRINTNGHGYILNVGRDVARELSEAGIEKVSVSLNAADEETYNEVCKPSSSEAFVTVLEFIRRAKDKLNVEVTAVTTPEIDIKKTEKLARELGVDFRIRPYIPCFW